jgi:hypothetical protein
MGMKIWSSAGTKLVEFSDVQNVISGWVIGATSISSGGINLVSSATAASNKIYIGTGTYNNTNTAFYVDGSGQMSLKDKLTWDGTNLAITGSLSAASANVLINSNGINLTVTTVGDMGADGLGANNRVHSVNWTDGGTVIARISANDSDELFLAAAEVVALAPTLIRSTLEVEDSVILASDTAHKVRVGGVTADDLTSVQLAVNSGTRAFLPPKMTTTQKNAITTPLDGMVLYDTTLAKLQVRTGGAWVSVH